VPTSRFWWQLWSLQKTLNKKLNIKEKYKFNLYYNTSTLNMQNLWSHLLVQSCTSTNFVNNSFAVNLFIYALFLMVILQTSHYSYSSKLSLNGSYYRKISVIVLGWLFNYRYMTILLLLHFDCSLCFFHQKLLRVNLYL